MSEKTVLIVDDDKDTRELLVKICTHFNYVIHEAEDGETGWALWQELHPDLTISDIYMPNMNGVQLLRNIRRTSSTAKVIMTTGYEHYKQLLENAGSKPSDFIAKPFDIGIVGKKIRLHIEA